MDRKSKVLIGVGIAGCVSGKINMLLFWLSILDDQLAKFDPK